jgi:hypothetical protein
MKAAVGTFKPRALPGRRRISIGKTRPLIERGRSCANRVAESWSFTTSRAASEKRTRSHRRKTRFRPGGKYPMQIDKNTIVSMLRERGDDAKAGEAERELPDQVDTDRDTTLLERFGINPQDLITKVTGGRDIPGL